MPESLTMGFFAFGAVLILISLLGGGFNIFSFGVSTTISNPVIRLTSFVLGAGFILFALNPAIPFPQPGPTMTATPGSSQRPPVPPDPPSTSTSDPPTQTSPSPTVVYPTAMPSRPSPVDFVTSYWQNISDGRYENAWEQLSPGFRKAKHNNDYSAYVSGYQQMNLCSVVMSNVNLVHQDLYSAVVTAHFTYYTGAQCNSSEYDFEMWLVYDDASNSWLFDRNIMR